MIYLCSTIPPSTLAGRTGEFRTVSYDEARDIITNSADFAHSIGNPPIAAGLSLFLHLPVTLTPRKLSVTLWEDDTLLCASMRGPHIEQSALTPELVAKRGFTFIRMDVDSLLGT